MGLFTQKRYKQHVETLRPSAPLFVKLLVYVYKYKRIIKRNTQLNQPLLMAALAWFPPRLHLFLQLPS